MVYKVKDSDDLETKLTEAGSKLVIIDFFASWCGPCKFISPKVEGMETEQPEVLFLKIDVDECEELASQYEISSMPTFVFVKEKKRLDSFSGANVDKLKELLEKYK